MVLMRVPVPDGRGRVSRQRRLGGVVATVAVVVVSALGAPAASAQMRAGLRLDVFVDDADGAPVTDLRRGDFFATRPRTLVEATIDLDAVQDGVTGGQSACRKGGRGGRFGDRGVLECPIVKPISDRQLPHECREPECSSHGRSASVSGSRARVLAVLSDPREID